MKSGDTGRSASLAMKWNQDIEPSNSVRSMEGIQIPFKVSFSALHFISFAE